MDYCYPIRVTASRYPTRTAVRYRDSAVSYATLDERSDLVNGPFTTFTCQRAPRSYAHSGTSETETTI
jgi:acyl-CoA synthetase (AMP-forming)/AMP-acid ligase II